LGPQVPAKNLRRFSQLQLSDHKNRTGIGPHPRAGKNQQFQANYRAMSGGLKLATDNRDYSDPVKINRYASSG
jgi:hypothetical protein